MKEKVKNAKGITLVALIVTIIVILILAGISINASIGKNGIIEKSKLERNKVEKDIENSNNRKNKLLNEMQTEYPPVIQDRAELKVGDYVDYKPDTPADKVFNKTYVGVTMPVGGYKKENLKWQVLNINEDKSVELIGQETRDYANHLVTLNGVDGYNNGVNALNDLCASLYSNSTERIIARSINQEDILKVSGKTPKQLNGNYGDTYTYLESNTQYPKLYEQENGFRRDSQVQGLTNGCINKVTDVKRNGLTESQEGDGTAKGKVIDANNLTVIYTYFVNNLSELGNNAAKVLPASNNQYYWVASRCVNGDATNVGFGLRYVGSYDLGYCQKLNSSSREWEHRLGVRPVVTIKPWVKIIPQPGPDAGSINKPHTIIY